MIHGEVVGFIQPTFALKELTPNERLRLHDAATGEPTRQRPEHVVGCGQIRRRGRKHNPPRPVDKPAPSNNHIRGIMHSSRQFPHQPLGSIDIHIIGIQPGQPPTTGNRSATVDRVRLSAIGPLEHPRHRRPSLLKSRPRDFQRAISRSAVGDDVLHRARHGSGNLGNALQTVHEERSAVEDRRDHAQTRAGSVHATSVVRPVVHRRWVAQTIRQRYCGAMRQGPPLDTRTAPDSEPSAPTKPTQGPSVAVSPHAKQFLADQRPALKPHEFPRVLVIATVSFNWEAGGGVTMCNLFKGWPQNRIAQIYTYGVLNKDMSVCRTYYRLPPIDRQFELTEGRSLFGRGPIAKVLRRTRMRRLLRLEHQYQEAIAFARQFKPDVAYVRPLDKPSSYWWFGHDLCKLLDIPYVTHIMDDWPARYDDDSRAGTNRDIPRGIRGRMKARRLASATQQTINSAANNIAISPEMAAAFGERYRKPFDAFHNTVDVKHWTSKRQERPAGTPGVDRPFVIRYVGGLMADKELRSLQEIAAAARRLHDAGRKIRFEIHCGPAWNNAVDEHLADDPVVGRGAFLTQDELPAVLSAADLLVLPINFDERSTKYVGYSMQTKGPEYMASGAPILVYGPATNPNVRYAKDAGWGIVIDQHDPTSSSLAAAIEGIITDPRRANEVARRADAIVMANHDASVVRRRFREVIVSAAASRTNA